MRKRILTGVICTALSVVMMGTTMVGAADSVVTSGVKRIQTTNKSLAKNTPKKVTKANARAASNVTAQICYTAGNLSSLSTYSFSENVAAYSRNDVASIYMPTSGTLIIAFNKDDSSSMYLRTGANNTGTWVASTSGNQGNVLATNVSAGTYYLSVGRTSAGTVTGQYKVYGYSNGNVGLNSSARYFAGNGGTSYQYFRVAKRSRIIVSSAEMSLSSGNQYGMSHSIQTASGAALSDREYSSTSNENTFFALNAGTYRIAVPSSSSYIYAAAVTTKAYTGKYATKKSKAQTVKRKKSKSNVLTAQDKNGRSHWYKIKVSKKRSSRIDVYSYNSSGQVKATLYKGGKRISYRTAYNPSDIYFKGTFKKGTYYVKVTKSSKTASGMYQVKYTK